MHMTAGGSYPQEWSCNYTKQIEKFYPMGFLNWISKVS